MGHRFDHSSCGVVALSNRSLTDNSLARSGTSGVHAVTARSQMATLRALLLCAGLGSALALRVPERGPASHLTRRAAMGAAILSVCAPADANAAGTSQRGAEDAYATQLFGSNTCVRRAL